jgi:hypothetical protein
MDLFIGHGLLPQKKRNIKGFLTLELGRDSRDCNAAIAVVGALFFQGCVVVPQK